MHVIVSDYLPGVLGDFGITNGEFASRLAQLQSYNFRPVDLDDQAIRADIRYVMSLVWGIIVFLFNMLFGVIYTPSQMKCLRCCADEWSEKILLRNLLNFPL